MIHKLQKQENKGKKPLIVLDSGFVSNHNLTQLKKEGFDYIVVGKKNKRLAYEKDFSSLPFKEILRRKGKTLNYKR